MPLLLATSLKTRVSGLVNHWFQKIHGNTFLICNEPKNNFMFTLWHKNALVSTHDHSAHVKPCNIAIEVPHS